MKVVLTIAGSDSGGGAGIQADLKTFEAFGVFGCSVITVLTAQNTKGVTDIFPISKEFITAQLKAVFDDFEISAVKIGMLFSKEIIQTVLEFVKELEIPVVFDPVFVSKAGSKLLNDDAKEPLKQLLNHCTVTTPNLYEAKELLGYEVASTHTLQNIFELPCSVVIKNHIVEIENRKRSVDTLYMGREKLIFDTPYIDTQNTHGTGCSFASAVCANLALGKSLPLSVQTAKHYVYEAIKNAPNIGHGKGVINHKAGASKCI